MRAILLSGGLALIISLVGTRYAIKLLSAKGYGQEIREDGPTSHHTKRGTPTMGGIVIILASVAGYFFAKIITQDLPSASAMLLLFLFVGLGLVGFLDDFIKIYKQRNLGLRSKAKMIGQTADRGRLRHPGAVPVAGGLPRLLAGVPAHLVHPRLGVAHAAGRRGDRADVGDHHRHQQRGEPHRRPRRPGRGRLDDGLRRLHAGEHLAEQPVVRPGRHLLRPLLRGPRPARPGDRLRGHHRRLLRLPLVERLAGPDLHGRHRVAVPGRRDGRTGDPHPHRAAAARRRRPLRRRDPLGDAPGRLLQGSPRGGASSGWRRCTTTSRCSAGSR